MAFKKIIFEVDDSGLDIHDHADAILKARIRENQIDDIATFLRRYDKHLDLTDDEQAILDKVRDGIFEIIND